jgi:hypothetical protein
MKLREKVALIWTFPIIFIVTCSLAIGAGALVFIAWLLNFTGTTGASIYLFEQMKLKLIDMRLRKLIKEDEKLYKFGSSKLKKDEDTTSTAN